MWEMPFTVPDKIECFGTGILRSVTADGPFTRNAGMEQGTAAIDLA
jgi:hypothetical protein